jgi:hypothetical protein
MFSMNGYDLINEHGEQRDENDHTERKGSPPKDIALSDNVPNRQIEIVVPATMQTKHVANQTRLTGAH